jgi:hypothetical protein
MSDTSLRGFGRLVACSGSNVRRALKTGVFTSAACGTDARGRPVIRNVELALADWERAGRRLRRAPPVEGVIPADHISLFTLKGLVVLAMSAPNGDFDEGQAFPMSPETAAILALRLCGCLAVEFPGVAPWLAPARK